MAGLYDELLESTIQNLRALKAQGTRFVAVSPERLERLTARPQTGRPPVRATGFEAGQAGAPAAKPAETVGRVRTAVAPPAPASPARTQAPMLQAESHAATAPASMLTAEAKAAAFAELRQRAMACVKCEHLASSRKQVVFGVGDPNAHLMFIGEAPGADEDQQGEPFVGKAGQLLTKIIQTMGLSRETVYIANILKCRPDMPPRSTGNRKPTPEEMQTCIPYLHEQIDLIRPKVIVALGATAVEGLLGKTIGITRLRGHWQTYRGIPLMPTYHPAYLLRNQAPSEKRRVWEDMLQVMEKLQMPISERQRQFFLKNNG